MLERTRGDDLLELSLKLILATSCRSRRRRLGLTQTTIARRIGVTSEFYDSMERGQALPDMDIFVAMMKALGASADALLGLTKLSTPNAGWSPTSPTGTPSTLWIVGTLLAELELERGG